MAIGVGVTAVVFAPRIDMVLLVLYWMFGFALPRGVMLALPCQLVAVFR
jgi:hypothetical protein